MNKIRFTLKAFAFLVFTLACATAAQAQATRTWVSGVGDDANPCSRTAPCKTFAGAISKTADGGEIDCIDPGGFGAVTLTKSVTIDGGGTFASILAAGTNGVNANDSASGAPMTKIIRLRNLSINGASTGLVGVNYTSAKAVFIENCIIMGFKAGSATGVKANLTASGGQLYVRDTIISDNAGDGVSGITTSGNLRVICDNVRADKNGIGFHAVANGNTSFHLNHCSASSNTADGVKIETGNSAVADHCTMESNIVNGFNTTGGTTRMSDTTIINNFVAGVNLAGGTVFSFGDNKIRSNGAGGTNNVAGGALNATETKQ
jgi:hypothetical protein